MHTHIHAHTQGFPGVSLCAFSITCVSIHHTCYTCMYVIDVLALTMLKSCNLSYKHMCGNTILYIYATSVQLYTLSLISCGMSVPRPDSST